MNPDQNESFLLDFKEFNESKNKSNDSQDCLRALEQAKLRLDQIICQEPEEHQQQQRNLRPRQSVGRLSKRLSRLSFHKDFKNRATFGKDELQKLLRQVFNSQSRTPSKPGVVAQQNKIVLRSLSKQFMDLGKLCLSPLAITREEDINKSCLLRLEETVKAKQRSLSRLKNLIDSVKRSNIQLERLIRQNHNNRQKLQQQNFNRNDKAVKVQNINRALGAFLAFSTQILWVKQNSFAGEFLLDGRVVLKLTKSSGKQIEYRIKMIGEVSPILSKGDLQKILSMRADELSLKQNPYQVVWNLTFKFRFISTLLNQLETFQLSYNLTLGYRKDNLLITLLTPKGDQRHISLGLSSEPIRGLEKSGLRCLEQLIQRTLN